MFTNSTLGKSLNILERTLDVAMLRRKTIANNIANVDTPNFKRSTISFESHLGRALASEQEPALDLKLSDDKHINPFKPIDYRTIQPRRSLDYLSEMKNNGNNVNIDEELHNATINAMRTELMMSEVKFAFRQLKRAIS